MAETALDRFPVKDLPARYGITRPTFYARIEPLKDLLKFEQEGVQKFANADQLLLLDRLNEAVKGDRTKEFLEELLSDRQSELSDRQSRQIELPPSPQQQMAIALAQEIARAISPLLPQSPSPLPANSPLHLHRQLDEAVDRQYLLSTSQVKQLLGVKPFGNQFLRLGFVFVRSGRCGREAAWLVRRSSYLEVDRHPPR